MSILLDALIGVTALLAAAYCLLLSRRLRAFSRLDGEVGKAIAVLSQQVDALSRALKAAEEANKTAAAALEHQAGRADMAARRLELLMAAHTHEAETPAVLRDTPGTAEEDELAFAPFSRAKPRVARARQR